MAKNSPEAAGQPDDSQAGASPPAASQPGDSQPGGAADRRPGREAARSQAGSAEAQERIGSRPDLLTEMKALRRQARAVRHAYWFPLVLFGLLTCAAVPFYVQPLPRRPRGSGIVIFSSAGPPLPFLGGFPGFLLQRYLAYYWIIALLGGLLATQLWYRWHARRVGLATPARAYLITTVVVMVVAIAIPLIPGLGVLWPGDLVVRGTFPLVIIAVGLLALAWAERSRALAVIAAVYTSTALLAILYDVSNLLYRLGWTTSAADESLPNVLLPAAVLLLAGAGAYAAQRRRRTAA